MGMGCWTLYRINKYSRCNSRKMEALVFFLHFSMLTVHSPKCPDRFKQYWNSLTAESHTSLKWLADNNGKLAMYLYIHHLSRTYYCLNISLVIFTFHISDHSKSCSFSLRQISVFLWMRKQSSYPSVTIWCFRNKKNRWKSTLN